MTEHYLDRLARTINENWDQPALTDFYLTEDGSEQGTSRGNHYTYGEMYREILRLGEMFAALGLQKGDHIAICAANSAHWAIAYLAIAAYQGVVVTVLNSQPFKDIARQIEFSDAKALFTDAELWNELENHALPQVKHVISMDNWHMLRGIEIPISNFQSPISNCQFSLRDSDDLAMICFTSGSTGASKGVMLPYRSVSNNVAQSYSLYPLTSQKNYLSLLPYAHVSGLIGDVLSHLVLGRCVCVLIGAMSGKYAKKAYDLLSPYMIVCVPQLFRLVFTQKQDGTLLIKNNCGLIFMGGAKLDAETEQTIMNSSVPLSMIYGQTETGASISISPYKQHRVFSSGKIVEGMSARIDENGEILVKGENVMLGYYKDPEATARKIDKDGWLHTGDRGHLDEDGYLYVEGRLEQDIIVLPNGENIHPEDIERKINALPEVKESIVLARDGKLVAIVVKSDVRNQRLDISDIDLRRHILRTINPELPLYSQLCDVEITDTPLQKTEKQTLKRYLYK